VRYVQPVAHLVKDHLLNALLFHVAPTDLKSNFPSVKRIPRDAWKWIHVLNSISDALPTMSNDGLTCTGTKWFTVRSSRLVPLRLHSFQIRLERGDPCSF
jgi:hypothetical protein